MNFYIYHYNKQIFLDQYFLFYYNLHNGEGTYGGGYKFCDKNGNTDYDNEEQDNFYHLGFSEEKFRKRYEKEMELLRKVFER